jgi:hypothetical protein
LSSDLLRLVCAYRLEISHGSSKTVHPCELLQQMGAVERPCQLGADNHQSMTRKLARRSLTKGAGQCISLTRCSQQLPVAEAWEWRLYQVGALVSQREHPSVNQPECQHLRLVSVQHRPDIRPRTVDG